MGFFLPIIAQAVASKVFGGSGGGQQQPQAPIFQFQKRPKVPFQLQPDNWALRGANPADAKLADNPILQAYRDSPPPADQAVPGKPKKQDGEFNFKDALMNSLIQNTVQRMVFGGGQQQSYNYAPPTFR